MLVVVVNILFTAVTVMVCRSLFDVCWHVFCEKAFSKFDVPMGDYWYYNYMYSPVVWNV